MSFSTLSRLQAFRMLKNALGQNGFEAAEQEAGLIVSRAISKEISDVFVYGDKPLSRAESRMVQKTLKRRLQGMPLQYAMNTAYFMGLAFHVDRRVLIPRPETELLVRRALDGLQTGQKVLDLCTGSGCIAVCIAKNSPADVAASDKYASALDVARKNAVLNGMGGRIAFLRSDLFENIEGRFDCIVSNPPYIPDGDYAGLEKNVREWEPPSALKAGDGLKYYRIIVREAKNHIKPGGRLFLEIGYDQREAVSALLAQNGWAGVRCEKDCAGFDRIIAAKV